MPAPQTSGFGPLDGIRVVDMTTVVMGPYATQILGDYGADVIKVEPPAGDIMRMGGPMRSAGMGALFLQANRNKRSIVLDVKTAGGRQALLRLCERADIFVHNVRPSAMRRLKLGDEEVRAVNPRIVYVSLIGYGDDGPYGGRPAYDDLIQGISAIAALLAQVNGGEPSYVPVLMADRIVGLNAAHAILAALVHRDRSGAGQAVELPMFETMAQFVLGDHMGGRTFEPPLGAPGYSRLLVPNRRPYRTSDGHLCVLVYNDKQWEAFFRAIGRSDEYKADPRLSDHAARARHYDEVYGLLADILRTRTTAEWMTLLQDNDVPCVPLNDLAALIDDPHLAAAGFFHAMEHPSEGKVCMIGIPSTWSVTPPRIARHAPRLGEHSIEVLREAGFAAAEIGDLIASGAACPCREG